MKKNNFVLPILIILTLCCVPCAIYGTFAHIKITKEHNNPKHLPRIGNILYFYDKNDNYIGQYPCENEKCDIAITDYDDDILKLVKECEDNNCFKVKSKVYNNEYVFIRDGININLYSLKRNQKIISYKTIKNYGIDSTVVIALNEDGKYGIINMNDLTAILPFEYDFIGVNKIKDNDLDLSLIAVNKDEKWFIINSSGEIQNQEYNKPIYDYNDSTVIYKSDDDYEILNYKGDKLVNEKISQIELYKNYVILISNKKLTINDLSFTQKYGEYYNIESFTIKDNILITGNNEEVDLDNLKPIIEESNEELE